MVQLLWCCKSNVRNWQGPASFPERRWFKKSNNSSKSSNNCSFNFSMATASKSNQQLKVVSGHSLPTRASCSQSDQAANAAHQLGDIEELIKHHLAEHLGKQSFL